MRSARERVDELLAQAGLDLPEADRELLAQRWALLRPAADSLYEISVENYGDPATGFDARPFRAQ